MDQIALLVLLILGVPLVVGIWLIIRAVTTRNQMEELTCRLDALQLELSKLKNQDRAQSAPASASKTVEEKIAGFTAAPVPPRSDEIKEEPVKTPPPVPEEALKPPLWLEQPFEAAVESFKTYEAPRPPAQSEPAAAPAEPVVPPASPIIPPPLPKAAFPAEPKPVLETAQVSADAATPPPMPPPPLPEKSSFEMRLGTFWLVRVGIIILLAGLAFAANLAYHEIVSKLGLPEKISLLYLASGLLLGAGAWWQRRNVNESLKNYAQVLFAGGLAAVYFTTYAAHYAPQVRVIPSVLLDGTLLFLWAGVIAWIADRRKSEVMALFAVCLAFFTSVITRVGEFTLYSNLILTVTAVVFLVRNRWAALSFASLATSYAGYTFWRFYDDGWHWATPDENLLLGAGFLASYWLVFTSATFLSKSEKLSGSNRAAFLTLNNGAFFMLFLLTMLQVHTGGFWKFSLGYGSALLVLATLAMKFLPAEPLAKNSYLTQGLALVTLGFISKFSGLQLALVLGMESVVLFVLGAQRQSSILKFFAYAAALLATGWCAVSLTPFDSQGLWTGAGLGAMLAFNAFWTYWLETKTSPTPMRAECSAFALLAFAAWTAAAWFNTVEPHLAVTLVLAVESAVFFQLLGGHKITAPKFLAYASALGAVIWCVKNLEQFDSAGLWTAIIVGALMVLNALRAHRADAENAQPLRAEPAAFTVRACAAWLAATWFNTTAAHLPLVLAAEAVAFTFSIYLLRVREITLLGQLFLIFAQLAWLFHYLNVTPPWWNPLAIIAITIGLSHWWQHQKRVAVSRNIFVCYSSLFALASVAVALVWLHPLVSAPAWLVLTSLLAVAATGYGLVTRAWALAICGQLFLAVSAWGFVEQLVQDKPEWYFPLAPIVVLAVLSFATIGWFMRETDGDSKVREPLLQVALVYRWLALLMSLLWIWIYVPERQRVWACMAAAAAVFALGIWRSSREALVAVAVYAAASLSLLWLRGNLAMDIYWPNLLSLLALLAMQQILRRAAAKLPLDENIHGAVVLLAGVSLWRFLSCWTSLVSNGVSVTMTWAGFALAVFVAGMFLRERFLRWFGLAVLATSIGRVVLVDVWNEKTIYRVLTFMALGLALLVVGFIYNKYQEKIRQWL
jgi:uncharacterized membrane protein